MSIYPHYDGNGRTSRLLMTLIQARFNLPYSVVYKEDKQDYFNALEKGRKLESLSPFRKFMDSQYTKYLKEQMDLYRSQNNKKDKGMSFIF